MSELAQIMLAARQEAEALMTDRCVVRRPTGETALDENYREVPVFDVVYHPDTEPHRGRCKVQHGTTQQSTPESAGATVTVLAVRADFPVGAFKALPGDVVTLIESADPLMAGLSVRLVEPAPTKTHATAYRVFADLNVGEEVPPWQG